MVVLKKLLKPYYEACSGEITLYLYPLLTTLANKTPHKFKAFNNIMAINSFIASCNCMAYGYILAIMFQISLNSP